MSESYATAPEVRGGVPFDAERLARFIADLNREGIDLHLHTVGDWATREALDAVERARREQGELEMEVSLSHLEFVAPEDIPRFGELGVHANFTSHWFVVSEAESYRAAPFLGMQMSVTRREYDDPTGPLLSPASARLPLDAAIEAYTLGGARQLGQASRLGSLEVGKRADFLVLDDSPFEVDPDILGRVAERREIAPTRDRPLSRGMAWVLRSDPLRLGLPCPSAARGITRASRTPETAYSPWPRPRPRV